MQVYERIFDISDAIFLWRGCIVVIIGNFATGEPTDRYLHVLIIHYSGQHAARAYYF